MSVPDHVKVVILGTVKESCGGTLDRQQDITAVQQMSNVSLV